MSVHFKKQNWFAIFIDFLVVVFGIFIALQVTEWDVNRVNKIEEGKYLTRLNDDFSLSIERNQGAINAINDWKRYHLKAVDSLTNQLLQENDKASFEQSLESIFYTLSPTMVLGTIQELMSTGKLSIIQSDDVIKSVLQSQEAFKFNVILFDSMQLRTYTQSSYLDGLFAVAQIESKTNQRIVDYNFEELSKNRKFLLHLKNTIGKLETNKNWLEALNGQLMQTKQLIENELALRK